MSVSLRFAWYDLWIGAYVDRPNRTLYICPLPCVLVTVRRCLHLPLPQATP